MMTESRSLLVVDDDTAMREMLASLFREKGYPVEEAASADEALERAREVEFDAVLSDVRMPGRSGVELVGELRRFRPDVPVVLMTAFGSVDAAVDAMRAGAFDYITKPFEPEAVLLTLERALEHRELEGENRRLRRALATSASLGDLKGESPALAEIVALIKKVAGSSANVLITGESGTGKEVVARTLHYHGARAAAPFVPINCTALPEGLLESELFGHVRGAFTGAHTSKRGLFETANGGTLFLDEIGDMGPALQGKLLRVLQDREIRPVGGNNSVKVDVRIVAATNKDVDKEMEAGRFREDLYYRLNVIPIHIPPLRERPEDVPALVHNFLRRHANGEGRSISPEAMRRLAAQPWRGNARELENFIERALALSEAPEIGVEDLQLGDVAPASMASLGANLREAVDASISLRELEERYTDLILEQTGGNKLRAAKILGIDRKTLYRRAERRRAATE
jgi:DNA-binding NtrC family response regulator